VTGCDMAYVPNILSSLRIACGPVLLYCAWRGWEAAFLSFFVLSLLSDLVDGFLARLLNQKSELGARLDSWGDFSIVLVLPLSVLWLWPHIIFEEACYITVAVASYFVPFIVGFIKFRSMASYHTWGAKLCAVLMGISLFLLFSGISAWPFRLSVPILVLESIEELAMTAVLRELHPKVPTHRHALQLRKQQESSV